MQGRRGVDRAPAGFFWTTPATKERDVQDWVSDMELGSLLQGASPRASLPACQVLQMPTMSHCLRWMNSSELGNSISCHATLAKNRLCLRSVGIDVVITVVSEVRWHWHPQ